MAILHRDSVHLASPSGLALLTVLLIVVSATYFVGRCLYNIFLHPLKTYPGPTLWKGSHLPWLYHIFKGDIHERIHQMHEKYGPVVRFRPDELSYNTADGWRDIYGFRQDHAISQLPKHRVFLNPLEKDMPHGIIIANDADHTRMRRNMSHAFSAKALDEQAPLMQTYFQLLIQRLRENVDRGPQDMVKWYNYTTFDLIGDLAFGEPFHCLETSQSHPWIDNLIATLLAQTYNFALQRAGLAILTELVVPKKLMQKRAKHFGRAKDLVARRMEKGADARPDFMSAILRNQGKPGQGISDAEMTPNASTIVFAGSETTASLLSGATFYLLQNPDKLGRLTREVRGAFQSDEDINFQEASKLSYLMAVLNESLRCFPPVPISLPRVVIDDAGDVICGRFVPPGTALGVTQWAASRSSANWHNPDSFVPERWLDDRPAEYASDMRDSAQPFAVGPRNCIGKNLAFAEMRQILAKVVWNFDLELAEESRGWNRQRVFGLWEKKPLMVHLRLAHKS